MGCKSCGDKTKRVAVKRPMRYNAGKTATARRKKLTNPVAFSSRGRSNG